MSIPNEGYVFEWDAAFDDRFAFVSPPTRKTFPANEEFYRVITAENPRTGGEGNHILRSPWWFTNATLRTLFKLSGPDGLRIGDVALIRLAVSKKFNAKMEWICVSYLTQAIYGCSGKAARRLATQATNIFFAGGETRVFLPNLAAPSGMASSYARIRYFGVCHGYLQGRLFGNEVGLLPNG